MKAILETKKSKDYYANIEVLVKHCSEKQRLEFGLHCNQGLDALYSKEEYPKIYETRQLCLKLVADYLAEPLEAKKPALEQAAGAAYAAYAATAATGATAYAASAAYAAAYAASAAYWMANATARATARAAARAAHWAAEAYAYPSGPYSKEAYQARLKELYEHLFSKLTEGMNQKTINILF